jgi:hemolysin activation/secretion protein
MRQTFWSGLVFSLALSAGVWAQSSTDFPESQVAPAELQTPAGTSGSASDTRRVENFTIEGNTLLEAELLERTVAPYKGRDLTLPEIKECAKALTTLYQMRGYYLVKAIVPVQDFKTTTVRLLITEGKLGELKVEGNNAYSTQYLKDYFQGSFGEDGNFRSDLFTRTTMLLNEQPDLNLKATLMPGSKPGTTDIILKAKEDHQFHVALDYNNYGTAASGEHRAGVNLEYSSLLFEGDQLLARGVLGFPSKENLFTQIQYQAPLDMDGTGINLSYSNGAFAVSQGLGAILDVRGSADIYTIGFSKALDRELDFSSNLGLSFSHKDVRNDLFGGLLPFSRDTYSTGRLTYQCQWRAPENMTFLNATATFGLGQSGTPSSRLGASAGSRFNLNLARIQHITPELNLVLLGAGQYATNPLFVAEQYAIGGPDTVRGFQQAQLLGDNAYQASAELRYSPIEGEPDLFQLVFFLDHGGVSLKRPQPGDLPFGSSLTGTGFGFRYAITPGSNLRVDLGFPLTPVQGNSSPVIYTGLQTKF